MKIFVYIFWKTVYIKYIELCTLFENCSTLYYIEFKTLCEGLDTECIDLTLSNLWGKIFLQKKKKIVYVKYIHNYAILLKNYVR